MLKYIVFSISYNFYVHIHAFVELISKETSVIFYQILTGVPIIQINCIFTFIHSQVSLVESCRLDLAFCASDMHDARYPELPRP